MRRLSLLALALTLAACTPAPQPTAQPPAEVHPVAPRLTITPHRLIATLPDRVGDRDALALRPTLGGVTIRIRLGDGIYSPGWGGERGQVLPTQGTGIGPLTPGTVFEVLDGGAWVEFARYE